MLSVIAGSDWKKVGEPLSRLRDATEAELPSLLTAEEKARRERLLLKLVDVIPKEYMSGVPGWAGDGAVGVSRGGEDFPQLARLEAAAELALTPGWRGTIRRWGTLCGRQDELLKKADEQIAAKAFGRGSGGDAQFGGEDFEE